MTDVRDAGPLSKFLAAEKGRVPCKGCVSCCYHARVDVGPDDSLKLDVIEDDLGKRLRRNDDGSCVHLTAKGCGVYRHRPKACREYDCRMLSAVGIEQHYGDGRTAPHWVFGLPSPRDRELAVALRLGARRHMVRNRDWLTSGALRAAVEELPTNLAVARRLVDEVAKSPEDCDRRLNDAIEVEARW